MWRYLAGGTAVIALIVAGFMIFSGKARPGPLLPAQPVPQIGGAAVASDPLPEAAPEATDRTREQKRFDRYDKDRDAKITREEYLTSRRKAFAKLDANGDGQLSFDEWSAKTAKRFADADTDRSGVLTAAEFATTKPKRKARRPTCACPAAPARDDD